MELKLKDALGRRKRHRGRQPTGKRIIFKEKADVLGLFAPLQRHGILPSHYLLEFRKLLGGCVNRNEGQHRLGDLYNEDNTPHGGPYLNRPADQFPPGEVHLQSIVYNLDAAAYRALGGARHQYASQADKGWYDHQLMTACITASMELATLKHGTVYGGQEAIFTHKHFPEASKTLARPIELNLGTRTTFHKETGKPLATKTTIIPDQLFKITYPPKNNAKIFVLEADRATEDLETVYEKLRRWVYVLDHDIDRKQWGTLSLIVMIYTTDEYRMRKFMAKLKTLTEDTDPFLFQFDPQFSRSWHVPPILYDVYEKPYYRADGSTFDISY